MRFRGSIRVTLFTFLGLGVLFLGLGIGFFMGFTVPENRDYRIAKNETLPIATATVTRHIVSNTHINNQRMYRVEFEWGENQTSTTRATFTRQEALDLVGQQVQIRVQGNRAVMVDFERSVLSMLGWIFLGTFGGIGVSFLATFTIIHLVRATR